MISDFDLQNYKLLYFCDDLPNCVFFQSLSRPVWSKIELIWFLFSNFWYFWCRVIFHFCWSLFELILNSEGTFVMPKNVEKIIFFNFLARKWVLHGLFTLPSNYCSLPSRLALISGWGVELHWASWKSELVAYILGKYGFQKDWDFTKLLIIVMICCFQGFGKNKLIEINWYFLSNSSFGKYFGK